MSVEFRHPLYGDTSMGEACAAHDTRLRLCAGMLALFWLQHQKQVIRCSLFSARPIRAKINVLKMKSFGCVFIVAGYCATYIGGKSVFAILYRTWAIGSGTSTLARRKLMSFVGLLGR